MSAHPGPASRRVALLVRHLLAVLLLPGTVVVMVPRWLLRSAPAAWTEPLPLGPAAAGRTLAIVAGVLLFAIGFALFAWCVALFARLGRGTLAPWDPTQRLVVTGPYRHVRNPMISGVALMLAGEAATTRAPAIAAWLALFVAVNHVSFLASEEPGLVRRFGAEYDAYRAAVPRWIPRATPWRRDAA